LIEIFRITLIEFCEILLIQSYRLQQYGKPAEGKRAKAYSQLEITTNKLLAVREIAEFISLFFKRIAVFAYRLNDSSPSLSRSINAFNRSPKSLDANFGNGFYFYQREYPALLVI